jgi:hypothetical protein
MARVTNDWIPVIRIREPKDMVMIEIPVAQVATIVHTPGKGNEEDHITVFLLGGLSHLMSGSSMYEFLEKWGTVTEDIKCPPQVDQGEKL